jgi:diguanylate cyclase (GGDEF)-like protein
MTKEIIETRKITSAEAQQCAAEAIQIIGSIQPHGFQLILDADTFQIVQHSSNTIDRLKEASSIDSNTYPELIGSHISEWVKFINVESLTKLSSKKAVVVEFKESGIIQSSSWGCFAHLTEGWISLEFSPNTGSEYNSRVLLSQIDNMVALLKSSHDETALFQTLVGQLQEYTQYDRVMMYRFLADWSGEIVAEAVSEREEIKYQGMRFPAEDIPKQARQLYTLSPIRLFADINAEPCLLEPAFLPDGQPLNQSLSVLRSMSTVHRRYLKNMGVGSSLSLSIKKGDGLWGMVVFHHNEPKIPTNDVISQLRVSGELFSEIITSYLIPAEKIKKLTYLMNAQAYIEASFNQAKMANISAALFESILLKIQKITQYHFIGIIYREQSYILEDTSFLSLGDQTIDALKNLFTTQETTHFQSEKLHQEIGVIPGLESMVGIAIMKAKIPNDFYVFIGKEEVSKTIKWGGAPQTVNIVVENNERHLEPRSSFALWRQNISGESSPWEDQDLNLLEVIFNAGKDFFSTKRSQMRINQLEKSAYFDPLTGLANRAHLRSFIEQLKEQKHISHVSVLFIDLDNFKDVNDFMGHETGDRLLVTIAQRLNECTSSNDLVARLGGDEFIIVLTHQVLPDPTLAELIADKIIQRIGEPILDNAHTLVITPSMGIISEDVKILDFNEALKQADIAMYAAKNKGKNRFHIFDRKDQDLFNKKTILTMDLRDCIAENCLDLHFQTQVNAQQKVIGIEVLARWNHEKFGFVSPDVFIEIAEKNNLIYPLGLQIIDNACSQLAKWFKRKPPIDFKTMSLNISPIQLIEPKFEEDLLSILKKHSIPEEIIRLEITESVFMKNYQTAINTLSNLREHGITISLDDFGTGFSSLNSLWKLPIDEVKIDKSFVSNMSKDDSLFTMVESVISLCKKLNLEVVAEGVEHSIEFNILKGLDCDIYQGYLFSKPLPAEQFEKTFLDE